MTSKLPRGHHPTELQEPRMAGLSVDAWSYKYPRRREVYAQLRLHGCYLVTVKVSLPMPRKKGKKK